MGIERETDFLGLPTTFWLGVRDKIDKLDDPNVVEVLIKNLYVAEEKNKILLRQLKTIRTAAGSDVEPANSTAQTINPQTRIGMIRTAIRVADELTGGFNEW